MKIIIKLKNHVSQKDFQDGLIDLIFKETSRSSIENPNKYIQIPKGNTSVESYAFSYNKNLKYILLPLTITTIKYYAFQECKNLIGINIPSSLKYIRNSAFYNCLNLKLSKDAYISLNSIESYAFGNCNKLKDINISKSITYLEKYSFKNCYNIEYIELPKRFKKEIEHIFEGVNLLNDQITYI